jgi:hypothetical protein
MQPLAAPETQAPPAVTAPAARWLMPFLTLLLAVLAVGQLAYFVPRCTNMVRRLNFRPPPYFDSLQMIPLWLAVAAAAALGVLAFWQRGSAARSALLATVAVAVNVSLLLAVVNTLFNLLHVWSP